METLSVEKQDGRKTKCPTWDKNENISFFLERLKFWDYCENHKSKYLDLIKSLQESGRVQEKQRIENEIKNRVLDPNDKDIIKRIILCMEKWLGKTKEDENSDSYDFFVNCK